MEQRPFQGMRRPVSSDQALNRKGGLVATLAAYGHPDMPRRASPEGADTGNAVGIPLSHGVPRLPSRVGTNIEQKAMRLNLCPEK